MSSDSTNEPNSPTRVKDNDGVIQQNNELEKRIAFEISRITAKKSAPSGSNLSLLNGASGSHSGGNVSLENESAVATMSSVAAAVKAAVQKQQLTQQLTQQQLALAVQAAQNSLANGSANLQVRQLLK